MGRPQGLLQGRLGLCPSCALKKDNLKRLGAVLDLSCRRAQDPRTCSKNMLQTMSPQVSRGGIPVSAASQVHYGALHVPKAILLSTGRIASGLLTTIAPMFLQEHNSA